jgi:hypothetical protein
LAGTAFAIKGLFEKESPGGRPDVIKHLGGGFGALHSVRADRFRAARDFGKAAAFA